MSRPRAGPIIRATLAVALFAVLMRAGLQLPHYGETRGPYEMRRAVEAVRAAHATNVNAFINFDLRGFDTLGEEFTFLVAVAGFSLILRERRGAPTQRPRAPATARRPRDRELSVRAATYVYVPVAVTFAIYIVLHGQLTPGGGFQGGVALAGGLLAGALGLGFGVYDTFAAKSATETVEALGGLAYIGVGIAAFIAAGSFLRNTLPHGNTGSLLSGGTILALNDAVGVAVAAGFVVLVSEFLNEMREES